MKPETSQPKANTNSSGGSRSGIPWVAICTIPVAAIGGYLAQGEAAVWMIAAGSAALTFIAVVLFTPSESSESANRDDASSQSNSTKPFEPRLVAASGKSVEPREVANDVLVRAIEVRSTERTALLDSIGDSVILVDSHGETRFANHAAGVMLGEQSTQAGTRHAMEALPSSVFRAVQAVIDSGGSERRRIETELTNKDATPVVILVNLVGHTDRLASVIVRDVHSEREADRMKSEFVAKASHELRTPLASLRAYAELLADGEVEDENQRREFAGIILSETGRLGALVDRMLDIGRIESGMARATYEQVDFCDLATKCVDEQQGEAQRRMISLKMTRADHGAFASADRPLMKQVILNLLSNAIKYTPDGGEVSVEVDTDNLARTVVVSVRDNGLGIPEHAIPRLFGKFYRVENHEKFAKGTGLGLNLCRNIVEAMHGGQIGVDSKVGVGSRFWFAIPMDQAARKAA
ncbi:MAG: Sensor histidine kinase YycG [Planctomycetota bacterium]|jgi:signal transduction histidine kinase